MAGHSRAHGKPAAELSDRRRLAIAAALGVTTDGRALARHGISWRGQRPMPA
jgi:hypothetical protein